MKLWFNLCFCIFLIVVLVSASPKSKYDKVKDSQSSTNAIKHGVGLNRVGKKKVKKNLGIYGIQKAKLRSSGGHVIMLKSQHLSHSRHFKKRNNKGNNLGKSDNKRRKSGSNSYKNGIKHKIRRPTNKPRSNGKLKKNVKRRKYGQNRGRNKKYHVKRYTTKGKQKRLKSDRQEKLQKDEQIHQKNDQAKETAAKNEKLGKLKNEKQRHEHAIENKTGSKYLSTEKLLDAEFASELNTKEHMQKMEMKKKEKSKGKQMKQNAKDEEEMEKWPLIISHLSRKPKRKEKKLLKAKKEGVIRIQRKHHYSEKTTTLPVTKKWTPGTFKDRLNQKVKIQKDGSVIVYEDGYRTYYENTKLYERDLDIFEASRREVEQERKHAKYCPEIADGSACIRVDLILRENPHLIEQIKRNAGSTTWEKKKNEGKMNDMDIALSIIEDSKNNTPYAYPCLGIIQNFEFLGTYLRDYRYEAPCGSNPRYEIVL